MTSRRIAGLLLVCISIFPPEARSQTATRSALAKALAKFPSSESLRVRGDSGVLEGQVEPMASDSLRLRTQSSGIIALPARSVRNIWVKRNIRPEAAGIGAMVGAIAGAIAGVNYPADPTSCADDCPPDNVGVKAVYGAIAGGVLGGVFGLIAGGMYHHWSQIFPD